MASLAMFVTPKQHGATLLEFSVTVAVTAILMTVLLQSMFFYQDRAEEAAVRQTIANVRSALEIKVATGKLPGRSVDLTILAEQNPLDLLKEKPANYVGALFHPGDGDIGVGNWCFDRADKTLVYLLNNRNSLVDAQTKRLKYKVKLTRLPQLSARPSGTPDAVGVAFEQVKD
ncbi:type II secretion system protein [Duganella callida]|uniref:Type II secretion system protein n=1 Tax=Duganella callida TaxID=2561932 RepID=A0A4Y9SJ74_9BURK|nr:type II secretion system protein [Duganella callida]TFW22395.1 type II secretion system protein [Duganella callida]